MLYRIVKGLTKITTGAEVDHPGNLRISRTDIFNLGHWVAMTLFYTTGTTSINSTYTVGTNLDVRMHCLPRCPSIFPGAEFLWRSYTFYTRA